MNFTFALEQFELFVLILIRLASFVFAAPFFNMANVPRKVKAGDSFMDLRCALQFWYIRFFLI